MDVRTQGFVAACCVAFPLAVFAQSPPADSRGFYIGGGGVWSTGSVEVGGIYGHRMWDAYGAPFATTDGWTYTAGAP
jgi:hypothetical protein